MSILSDRRQARFVEGTFPFLFSVALVAVATIVLFSIASISQLDASRATLRGSPIDNSLLDDKVIGTVVSYPDSNASPVSARTKSPSSSDADNNRKASTTAIETGSTQSPSTVEAVPSGVSAPQEVSAQPASIADAASAAHHAAGVTVPTQAISDEQRDQMFRDSEIQRNGHTNLDQGSAAERGFGLTSSRGSPPLRHATSHRQDAAEAGHKITQKLNRLELGRLLKGSRASLR
jgi:hypothetical protein